MLGLTVYHEPSSAQYRCKKKILVLKCAIRENGATDHKDLNRCHTGIPTLQQQKMLKPQDPPLFCCIFLGGVFKARCWALDQS
jgi:hypothetical protein